MIGQNGEEKNGDPSTNGHAPAFAAGHKFAPGNKLGRGNPFNKQIARFRGRIFDKVTDEQFDRVVAALVRKAEAGEGWAIHELFDRLLGKATERVEVSGQINLIEEVRARMAEIIVSPRLRAAVEEEYRSRAG